MKLGEKRGNSIFYKNNTDKAMEPKEIVAETETILEHETSLQERADTILTTEKKNAVPIELGVKNNAHSIFFAPETEGKEFSAVLKEVQEYISENYAQLITDNSLEDAKEQMKRYISKFVMEKRIAVKGMNGLDLIEAL
ncbi:MAG: type II secretion system protein E, partial [Candidatus Riflebacteria bacterium]|nr:type II secretion system protein E [Candidatus Riflebacteria bacterium]